MKKLLAIILATALVILLSASCGPPAEEITALEYEIIEDVDALPENVKEKVASLKKERGYFVFTPEDYADREKIYLLVSSGEKPTGGYAITVKSVSEEDAVLHVLVEETEPAADEYVIQVLTYPLVVLELNRVHETYTINTAGESFNRIAAEETPADELGDTGDEAPEAAPELIEKEGVFTGIIDSNFMEIKVDGKAMSYMYTPDFSWIFAELLNTGDNVVFTYYENEWGQRVIEEIDTAERAAMVRGVSGILNGLIDSHSVEIEVDGSPRAYALAEQVVLHSFNEGDSIIFDYYEDQHGRPVINRIEKAQ